MRQETAPRTGEGERHVYAILLVQSLLASGTHIIAKVVVRSVDPFTLTLVRSTIASVAMVTLLALRRRMPVLHKDDWWLLAGLAFLAVPINQFLYLYGTAFTIPSNAALLYATTPIIVLVFSRWFLGEKLTRRKVTGVVLGFVGVTVVIFERGLSASREHVYGNLVVFVAVLAWALYTVQGRRLIAQHGAIEASALTVIGGTILFLPFGIVPALRFPYAGLTESAWLQIFYLGIGTSVLGYLLWYYALGRLEAGKVALFANLQPVLTTVLGVVLLGNDVTPLFVLGGAVAIAGVIVAQFG